MDEDNAKSEILFESFERLFDYYKVPYEKYHDAWKKRFKLAEALYCTVAIALGMYLISKNGEENTALIVTMLVILSLFLYGSFQAYGRWKMSQFNAGSRIELDEHLRHTKVINDDDVMNYYVEACRDYIASIGASLWGELITIILTYAMVPFFGAALGGFFSDMENEESMIIIMQVLVYSGLAIILLIGLKIWDRYSENGPYQRKRRAAALLSDLQYLRVKRHRQERLKKQPKSMAGKLDKEKI